MAEEAKANIEANDKEAKLKESGAPAKPEGAQPQQQSQGQGHGYGQGRRRERKTSFRREIIPSEFVEKVISINRVSKVTKGGKKMSFSALVVVGDGKGRVGYSLEKAGEVADSIKKSLIAAKKNMIRIQLKGATIPHQIDGVCGAAVVMLKPALEGTGVIAAGPVRAVCDAVGIKNILTKCHRSNNPVNVVKATIDGLSRLKPFANVVREEPAKEIKA